MSSSEETFDGSFDNEMKDDKSDRSDIDFLPKSRTQSTSAQTKRSQKIKIIKSAVCSALDRLRIPNRSGSMLLSTVAYECGVDIQQCSTSRESLRRARIENRHFAAKQIKENFNPTVPLTIHWDGKLLLDLNDRDHVHRLPVLVTGHGIEKLLAVPKLEGGTGRQMAQATVKALKDWNI